MLISSTFKLNADLIDSAINKDKVFKGYLPLWFFNNSYFNDIQSKFNIHKFRIKFLPKNEIEIQYPLNNPYFYVELVKEIQLIQLAKPKSVFAEHPKLTVTFLNLMKKHIKREKKEYENKNTKYTKIYLKSQFGLFEHQCRSIMELDKRLSYVNENYIKSQNKNATAGLILNQPRTGKTRTSLVYGLLKGFNHYLIVAPKSALSDWRSEIDEIMKTKGLAYKKYKVIVIEGEGDIVKDEEANECILFYITNYERLRTFSTQTFRNIIKYATKGLKRCFIADESHRLRNFDTLQSQAVFAVKYQLTKVLNKDKTSALMLLGLTGTPAIKHTLDAFGLLAFVNLGGMWLTPNENSFGIFKNYFYDFEVTTFGRIPSNLKRSNELQHVIKSISVQYKTKELDFFKGYDIKRKIVHMECGPEQKRIYNEVQEKCNYETIDVSNAMVHQLRLRQIAINPGILLKSYTKVPPKYKWVLNKCTQKDPIPTIFFSKSVKVLTTLTRYLKRKGIKLEYLNGSSSIMERAQSIENFQKGKVDFIFLQIDVGRENLTLSRAMRTVFIDRDFTVGYNDQAEARQFPTSPKEVTKEIIDLIMLDTNEPNLYDRLVVQRKDIKTVNDIKAT